MIGSEGKCNSKHKTEHCIHIDLQNYIRIKLI